MKKQIKKLVSITAMLAMATLLFSACSKDDDKGTDGVDYSENYTVLSGDITSDTTWDTPSKPYLITGPVVVKSGTLTIEAGQVIYALPQFASYLLVTRDGKIDVKGTAAEPVIFTCSDPSQRWGGLIINGYAKISSYPTTITGSTEIANSYLYGGDTDTHSSGSIEYLILDRTGQNDGNDIEHNGLTLNAVGSQTTIKNVYVTNSYDDGIEFFGGCVDVENLLVVDCDDDMFDFTQGYSGTLSNCYGIWTSTYTSTEGDPSGIECDGNLDGKSDTDTNQSNFTIKDMTIVQNSATQNMIDVLMIRRGATVSIENGLIKGTGTATNLVDLYNSRGKGTLGSTFQVSYSGLTIDALYNTASDGMSASDYEGSGVNIVNDATTYTGCDTSEFAWTKFDFTNEKIGTGLAVDIQ